MTVLNHHQSQSKCLNQILKIVPEGTVVDSHLFFSGDIELSLAKYNRFVCARTTQFVVFEFWKCLLEDSSRIFNIVSSEHFKFEIEDYPFLQEHWAHYKDEYIRSSFFYLLNKLSDTGGVSSGNFKNNKINKTMLANLKTFKMPKNFHLIHDKCDFVPSLSIDTHCDYKLINAGNYISDTFLDGKTFGLEDTKFSHNDLHLWLDTTNTKTIILYKFNDSVVKKYKNHNLTFINEYGKITDNIDKVKEIIVANF